MWSVRVYLKSLINGETFKKSIYDFVVSTVPADGVTPVHDILGQSCDHHDQICITYMCRIIRIGSWRAKL